MGGSVVTRAASALVGRGVARSARNARTAAAVGAGGVAMRRVAEWETTPMRIVSNTGPGVAGRAAAIGAGANVANRTARAESELRTLRGSETSPSGIAERGLKSLKNARTNPNIVDVTGTERRIVKSTSAQLEKELIRQRDTITRARNLIGSSAVERALDLKGQNLSRGQKAAQTRRDNIVNKYLDEAYKVNMAAQREKRRGG